MFVELKKTRCGVIDLCRLQVEHVSAYCAPDASAYSTVARTAYNQSAVIAASMERRGLFIKFEAGEFMSLTSRNIFYLDNASYDVGWGMLCGGRFLDLWITREAAQVRVSMFIYCALGPFGEFRSSRLLITFVLQSFRSFGPNGVLGPFGVIATVAL